MKCAFTYSSVSGFLLAFFFPGAQLHFTRCSALDFPACFLSTFLLIFAMHLAAASLRSLTFSGVPIIFSLSAPEFHCLASVFGFHPVHFFFLFPSAKFVVSSSSCILAQMGQWSVPDWVHPRTWSFEWRGWQECACTREQVPQILPLWWRCPKTVGD